MPYASPAIESLFGLNPEAVGENVELLFAMINKDDIARVWRPSRRPAQA